MSGRCDKHYLQHARDSSTRFLSSKTKACVLTVSLAEIRRLTLPLPGLELSVSVMSGLVSREHLDKPDCSRGREDWWKNELDGDGGV
jgi:hypothetical protein